MKKGLAHQMKAKHESEMTALYMRVVNESRNYREAAEKLGVGLGMISWRFKKNGIVLMVQKKLTVKRKS